MESRKVQKVGASTLSVSLPKEWAQTHHVSKGDIMLFENLKDGSLRIYPNALTDAHAERIERVYLVNADLCTEPNMLGRVVIGNYVIGRNHVRIRAKSRIKSEHLQEVRRAVNKLMGLGIMMETPEEIELQCSIDPSRFPMETVMKRLYTIGATMQKEAVEAIERRDRRLAEDARDREDEADMIYWLGLRLLLTAQSDPQLAERIGIHYKLPILGNRLIMKNLETIADYANSIAQNALRIFDTDTLLDPGLVKKIRRASDLSASVVSDSLSCIFSHDMHLANKAIETKKEVEDLEGEIVMIAVRSYEDPIVVASLRALAWSLRRIAEYGTEIAVIGINRYLERDSALCRAEP